MMIQTTEKINLKKETTFGVFDTKGYLLYLPTYYAYFGVIPSYKTISGLNPTKAMKWIAHTYSNDALQNHRNENYNFDKKRMECEDLVLILNNNMLLHINDCGFAGIAYQQQNEEAAQAILVSLKSYKQRQAIEAKIHVIINGDYGLDIKLLKCPKPHLDMNKNYNDDLQQLHTEIMKELTQKNKSGLYLFHGKPGTGKSTYIRHLISNINKKFIFLSPRIAGNLDSPNFVNLLIEQRNMVLIIEDAEELLGSREKTNNGAISVLLNITDGLLGESLGIQTICTFNTPIHNIDEALMRKGRLKAMYEFKELTTHKANQLLKENGADITANAPMTLAEIYNSNKQSFVQSKPKNIIGFKVGLPEDKELPF